MQDPREAWKILAVMGAGAKKGLNTTGIRSYEEAEAACVLLRRLNAASGAPYEVDDLTAFLCLATHTEATPTLALPVAATPVSIELDLGVSARNVRPKWSRLGTRSAIYLGASAQESLPESTRSCTRSQPLVRIWRKTKENATMSSVFVSVLHELLGLVTSIGAASICNCSCAFHGGGLYMARRNRQRKQNIARRLEDVIYSKQPALIFEGVSRSELMRTKACAWNGIDTCDKTCSDERLVALALLRMCAKFELSRECRDIVLKHIGAGTHSRLIPVLKWSLLRRLKARSQPMSVDDVLQPLA